MWKAIKSLGLPNKFAGCIVYTLAENQIVKHDNKSILKTFKSFNSNLAGNLLAKLPQTPNRYTINFVCDYLKKRFFIIGKFQIGLNNWRLSAFEVTKAAGID